jgi:hypothetical protein
MEKQIVTVSYWLGLLSSLIAMGMWGLSILGRLAQSVFLVVHARWYESFFKGAILFFLIAVATASYTFVRSEKTL